MTVFRLEHFPNVCRVCLHHPQDNVYVPIGEYMQQYSVKLIDFIDELTVPIPAELHHIIPSGVCLTCFDELNAFLSYRKRLNLVVRFISSLAQIAKGQTNVLEELISEHGADLLAVLQELNIVEKNELVAQDLLDEFDQYCIGEMMDVEVANEVRGYALDDEFLEDNGTLTELEVMIQTNNISEKYMRPTDESGTKRTSVTNTQIVLLNQEEIKLQDNNLSDGNMSNEERDLIDNSANTSKTSDELLPVARIARDTRLTTRTRSYKGQKKEELLKCEKCKFQTFHSDTFKLHMEKHRKANETFEPTFCKRCKLFFDSKRELAKHRRSAHRDYTCDTCGMSFDSKFSLHTHRKRHEKVRQYKCEYCPVEYHTKTEQALHVRQAHLKAFEVNCPECAMPFRTKQMLNQHMKSHTNLRTHTCSICGYSFKSNTHLSRHMKGVHQGVQYSCEHCNTSYQRRDKLRLHMENVHNIQTYFVCDICLQSYNSEDMLEKHKTHHRNPKHLQCGVCLGAFLAQNEFNEHLCITYRENYICCNRDFKFHFYYNKHMFLAHGEHTNVRVKPTTGLLMGQFRAMRRQEERCAKCGMEFPTRNQKKHHMETCEMEVYEEEYIDQQELDVQLDSSTPQRGENEMT